jgi:hypothetical protein
MQTSHDTGRDLKPALGLLILAIGIAITAMTGRALIATPDSQTTNTTATLPRTT